jgi:nitroreductase
LQKLDFIYNRHSVRQYKDADIPTEDILEIIKAATYAPSGGNVQNWYFIVIKNKRKIAELVKIIEDKNEELVNNSRDEEKRLKFKKYLKFQTVFKSAPAVVLVYGGPYTGLDQALALSMLVEKGVSEDEIKYYLKTAPGIQNIGAAMENLLLAATALGYGTCWITSANFAINEIEKFINLQKEGYSLVAMTPIGRPLEDELKNTSRKKLDEVLTFIE